MCHEPATFRSVATSLTPAPPPSLRPRLPPVCRQYRESVLEISAVLQQLQPTVRAMHFIGQSTGRSSRGFSQKEQLKVRTGRGAGSGWGGYGAF